MFEEGRCLAGLDAYRDVFVERASRVKLSERASLWLWAPTEYEALLKEGEVGTSHYGDFHVTRSV